MRVLVYGAGAVGGVVAARLHERDHQVTVIARGAHLEAIRRDGLRLATSDTHLTVRPQAVEHPREIDLGRIDAVLLTMKSQDTLPALADLARRGPVDLPVVCVQNGVHNEYAAQRYFGHVYAATVMCPAAFLEPGRVIAYATPTTGILDLGRYPDGVDDTCRALAAALNDATFVSEARADIMRWKYRKLITNVGNAVEALCGPAARRGRAGSLVTDEAERVLDTAGISVASAREDVERRGTVLRRAAVEGAERPGGSMWQSLGRGVGSIEADYLNGEVVRIARAVGSVAPVNATVQRLCAAFAAERRAPASMTEDDLTDLLERVNFGVVDERRP